MHEATTICEILSEEHWALVQEEHLRSACAFAGQAFLLGAQPPQAQTLELWEAVAGHADVTEVENAVVQWLEFLPFVFAENETTDMSLLTLDLLEVQFSHSIPCALIEK